MDDPRKWKFTYLKPVKHTYKVEKSDQGNSLMIRRYSDDGKEPVVFAESPDSVSGIHDAQLGKQFYRHLVHEPKTMMRMAAGDLLVERTGGEGENKFTEFTFQDKFGKVSINLGTGQEIPNNFLEKGLSLMVLTDFLGDDQKIMSEHKESILNKVKEIFPKFKGEIDYMIYNLKGIEDPNEQYSFYVSFLAGLNLEDVRQCLENYEIPLTEGESFLPLRQS